MKLIKSIDMKVKKTVVKLDYARSIFKKSISLIEVEDIKVFIKAKEDSLGTRGINLVEHESCDGVFHKLKVCQDDLDPLGDTCKTTTYEWED